MLYVKCTITYFFHHYDDVTMGGMASHITSLTILYSIVYSGADQRKHQSPASLAFVRGIHRGPVISPHKWPVTGKRFPFDDVIMTPTPYNGCNYLPNIGFKLIFVSKLIIVSSPVPQEICAGSKLHKIIWIFIFEILENSFHTKHSHWRPYTCYAWILGAWFILIGPIYRRTAEWLNHVKILLTQCVLGKSVNHHSRRHHWVKRMGTSAPEAGIWDPRNTWNTHRSLCICVSRRSPRMWYISVSFVHPNRACRLSVNVRTFILVPCHHCQVPKNHLKIGYLRKRWGDTACCEKSKFAISSGWLKKGNVSHPDDIIQLP